MGKIKAVLLDMYGVVLKDTGDSFLPFVQETFPDKTFEDVYSLWFQAEEGKMSSYDVFKGIGYKGSFEDIKAIEKEYLDRIEVNEDFYEFSKAMEGKVRLALISNDTKEWSEYIRAKHDLNRHFEIVHVSGNLQIKKPDERIFKLTLEKLGLKPEECIFADDRRKYLDGARALGINTVLFNTRNVEYTETEVKNFAELKQLILGE